MIKMVLIVAFSFFLGSIFGFMIAALLAAGRWHDDLEE